MPREEEQHFWTGSEWLTGDTMQTSNAGHTKLFTVPTTSGWRVELGDPTYPLRYWDGAETNFTVDSDGDIVARTITLYPNFGGTAAAVTVDAAGAGTNVHAFSFIDRDGNERFYLRAATGELRTNSVVEQYADFADDEATFKIGANGDHFWGVGGASPPDVYLFRSAANTLALNTGDSFVWTGALTSRLDSSGYIQLAEQTAPAAPAANQVRLYAVDNGAGKTQLMALFSSGAAQQIAIQP